MAETVGQTCPKCGNWEWETQDIEFTTHDGGSPIYYRLYHCRKCGHEERSEAWSATD